MFIMISVDVITCKLFMQNCVVIISKFIKTNIAAQLYYKYQQYYNG